MKKSSKKTADWHIDDWLAHAFCIIIVALAGLGLLYSSAWPVSLEVLRVVANWSIVGLAGCLLSMVSRLLMNRESAGSRKTEHLD